MKNRDTDKYNKAAPKYTQGREPRGNGEGADKDKGEDDGSLTSNEVIGLKPESAIKMHSFRGQTR